MHLILIRTDMISRIYKEKITPIAHVKILEVAGRTDMCYLDDFLIKKVLEIHSISIILRRLTELINTNLFFTFYNPV